MVEILLRDSTTSAHINEAGWKWNKNKTNIMSTVSVWFQYYSRIAQYQLILAMLVVKGGSAKLSIYYSSRHISASISLYVRGILGLGFGWDNSRNVCTIGNLFEKYGALYCKNCEWAKLAIHLWVLTTPEIYSAICLLKIHLIMTLKVSLDLQNFE